MADHQIANLLKRIQLALASMDNVAFAERSADATPDAMARLDTVRVLNDNIKNAMRNLHVSQTEGRREGDVPIDILAKLVRIDEIPALVACLVAQQERIATFYSRFDDEDNDADKTPMPGHKASTGA